MEEVINDRKLIEKCLSLAKESSIIGGSILRSKFGKSLKIKEKSENDFVTDADMLSEDRIVKFLRGKIDADFLLEERRSDTNSKLVWMIDPLDGTQNFIRGIPIFCVSVALVSSGDILVGVVYNPCNEEMFWSVKGRGAYKNKNKIRVSKKKKLHGSLLATGFPFKCLDILQNYLKSFEMFLSKVSGVRRMGSAAMDLCMTAEGKFDGFWEWGLSPWDIAAGALILKEAGGRITDFWGGDNWLAKGCVVGSNRMIHREMINITSKCFNL